MLAEERADRLFPVVQYEKLTIVEGEVDEIHDEITDMAKAFEAAVALRGFVAPEQERHPLAKHGIEKVRNVILSVTVPHLIAAALATQDAVTLEVDLRSETRDRFTFSTMLYDILEVRRGRMFANTDIPIYIDFLAERYRPESTSYKGV